MAIETLQTTLPRWGAWKKNAVELFADSAYPVVGGAPKFLGTLIQRFNIRKGKAARPYRDNIDEINATIRGGLIGSLAPADMTLTEADYGADLVRSSYCLALIPDFQGLLPKAQSAGVPIFDLTDEEIGETGVILNGFQKRRAEFGDLFAGMSTKIVQLLEHA